MAILPDRRPETVTTWLKAHPSVQIVSRDSFSEFRQGITVANSSIIQIYDRFHFFRNAKKQLDSYASSVIPSKISWMEVKGKPKSVPLTRAVKRIHDNQKTKWMLIQEIQERFKQTRNISLLAKEYHLDWRTVQKYIKMKSPPDNHKERFRLSEPFEELMFDLEGRGYTVKEIYAEIQNQGYAGTFSGVRTYIQNVRRDRKNNTTKESMLTISRRKVCVWIWNPPNQLNEEEKATYGGYWKVTPF